MSKEQEPTSWIRIEEGSDFSLINLPYGVFSPSQDALPRCGVAIGDSVVDLAAIAGLLCDIPGLDAHYCFAQPRLNEFMACPRSVWKATRARLIDLLSASGSNLLRSNEALRSAALHDRGKVKMQLPVHIGDYTDFYSSREHATRVGTILRDANNPLNPNWLHLPVAYHGRASSVILSGQSVTRPCGQLQKDKQDPKQGSVFGATKSLDYELEAEDHIFGMVLLNDWSARDIQAWEYVPLGPFGAKNFATTISPWVVSMEALEPFRCPTSAGTQDPVPLEYLQDPNYDSYDINLEVLIQGAGMTAAERVAQSNFVNMYWNIKQQLVHHTVTGCSMRAGDLVGSGTISGSVAGSEGCLLESSWRGTVDVPLGASGHKRRFLEDGDSVVLRGWAAKPGLGRVGFGEAVGTVLPAAPRGVAVHHPAAALGSGAGGVSGGAGAGRYHSFKLYSYWRSSCSWRVRTALAAKGIPYEYCAVNLLEGQQQSSDYASCNPMQQVPTLEVVDGMTGRRIKVRQSLAIIEFLEEAFPAPVAGGVRLLPAGALERAHARELAEVVNSGTQPLQNMKVVKILSEEYHIDSKAWAAGAIERGLKALERLVIECEGSPSGFCLGPLGTGHPTVVDMCMVPQIYNARRHGLDVEAICPTLAAIDAVCREHPWFIASDPANQPDAERP